MLYGLKQIRECLKCILFSLIKTIYVVEFFLNQLFAWLFIYNENENESKFISNTYLLLVIKLQIFLNKFPTFM